MSDVSSILETQNAVLRYCSSITSNRRQIRYYDSFYVAIVANFIWALPNLLCWILASHPRVRLCNVLHCTDNSSYQFHRGVFGIWNNVSRWSSSEWSGIVMQQLFKPSGYNNWYKGDGPIRVGLTKWFARFDEHTIHLGYFPVIWEVVQENKSIEYLHKSTYFLPGKLSRFSSGNAIKPWSFAWIELIDCGFHFFWLE